MKGLPSFVAPVVVALGLALFVPGLTGCGAEEKEGEGAAFPQQPVGYDAPEESSSSAATAALPAPPPAPPGQSVEAVSSDDFVPGATSEEYAAQAGDVSVGTSDEEYSDADPSALTDFRSTLDPYGSWVDDPNYGTVWTPSDSVVGSDFAPYVSGGHWSYDDDSSWVWMSDYDWGWAPFHYGRWAYLGSRWGWIPGREYAGAWVNWRVGYGGYNYLGWAPMAPAWGWRNGYAFGLGFRPGSPYVFCGAGDVFRGNVGSHLVPGAQVGAVASHSRVYASPTVGTGRVAAHPTVGPPPTSVGISPNAIARTPINDRGVMHAQQFARPATAQALGARAPMGSTGSRSFAQAPSRSGLGMSAYGGRNAPVASSPRYVGSNGAPYRSPYSGSSHAFSAYGGYGAAHYGSTYSSGRYYQPSYGGGYGGYRAGGAYGGYRGGAYHAAPQGGSSTHHESGGEAAPSYHGGGGYRGGGGFRGGGGGGHGGGGHR